MVFVGAGSGGAFREGVLVPLREENGPFQEPSIASSVDCGFNKLMAEDGGAMEEFGVVDEVEEEEGTEDEFAGSDSEREGEICRGVGLRISPFLS